MHTLTQLLTTTPGLVPLAGGGFLDWIEGTTLRVGGLTKVVITVFALLAVLWAIVRSRFQAAVVIVSILGFVLVLALVLNMDGLADMFKVDLGP